MTEKSSNQTLKKLIPIGMAVIGFVLYQMITIPLGFEGMNKSLGAGATLVVFYYLGTLLNKLF